VLFVALAVYVLLTVEVAVAVEVDTRTVCATDWAIKL
jgi:hypothetical protein